MPLDSTPSTAELCERADAACAETRRLVQELNAGLAQALEALHRADAACAEWKQLIRKSEQLIRELKASPAWALLALHSSETTLPTAISTLGASLLGE